MKTDGGEEGRGTENLSRGSRDNAAFVSTNLCIFRDYALCVFHVPLLIASELLNSFRFFLPGKFSYSTRITHASHIFWSELIYFGCAPVQVHVYTNLRIYARL